MRLHIIRTIESIDDTFEKSAAIEKRTTIDDFDAGTVARDKILWVEDEPTNHCIP